MARLIYVFALFPFAQAQSAALATARRGSNRKRSTLLDSRQQSETINTTGNNRICRYDLLAPLYPVNETKTF